MSNGQSTGLGNWIYSPSELVTNIPSDFFVRLENFQFTPLNRLESRPGLEPVHYFINSPETGYEKYKGLITPSVTVETDKDCFLNNITTATLELFGDALIFSGPNASSFHIVPFSLTKNSYSKHYEYIAKDENGVPVPGDERGGYHIYNGKPLFWNGRGTYQTFANSISEQNFTRISNSIATLEDQTIIAACTFENRLVVATLQGYLMWSQPDWNGTDPWQDSVGSATNFLQITTDPGEIIEFVTSFRGGIMLSTKRSSNVSGRIINIPTLDQGSTNFSIIDTGVDSFFTRNSLITSTDTLVGICPQGVINVSYDSLARSAKAEFSQSAPIVEYLNEVFYDNTIFPYIDAHLDTKKRKGYFIHDWSMNNSRVTKILVYDYNCDKWSLFTTELPIQRIFQMYDHICAAGWVRNGNKVSLAIWSLSDYNADVSINSVTTPGGQYTWTAETDIPFLKRFVTGVQNLTEQGPHDVPGSQKKPKQVLMSYSDPAEYKFLMRAFSKDNWSGKMDDVNLYKMEYAVPSEEYGLAQWDVATKNHEFYQRYVINIPNVNLYYQLVYECSSEAKITLHSIEKNRHNVS